MPATNRPATASLAAACDAVFTLDAPAVVGLVDRDGSWELRDGPHYFVPEDLIGFVAPRAWDGIAAVSLGTAHDLEAGASLRARVTFALDRTGRGAGSITTVEGTTRLASDATQPTTGHLADVCHRALGLPAAPEPSAPIDLLVASWLADVISAAESMGDDFPVEDWEGVVSLCPFEFGTIERPTWADLHRALVGAGHGWGELSADDVAWTDPPTLARLMLATLPPVHVLLDEVTCVLPEPMVRRMVAVITAAGAQTSPLRPSSSWPSASPSRRPQ